MRSSSEPKHFRGHRSMSKLMQHLTYMMSIKKGILLLAGKARGRVDIPATYSEWLLLNLSSAIGEANASG
jgi:hypothetical protein